MMFFLTPPVNVPAERAKLRQLRNEINAQAQARLKAERNYADRGYGRPQLPDMPALATERLPSNGQTTLCQVQQRTSMAIPTTKQDVQSAQAGRAGAGAEAAAMEFEVMA